LGSEDFVNAYFKDAYDKDYDCYLFIIGFKGFANILSSIYIFYFDNLGSKVFTLLTLLLLFILNYTFCLGLSISYNRFNELKFFNLLLDNFTRLKTFIS